MRSRASSTGAAVDSDLLRALAYFGFMLNLFNLAPIAFLDGGHILRSWRILRAGGGAASPAEARRLAGVVAAYSVALAAASQSAWSRRTSRRTGCDGAASSTAGCCGATTSEIQTDVAFIAAEFLAGFQKVDEIGRVAVSFFGSARVGEDSAPYRRARETAGLFAKPGSRS